MIKQKRTVGWKTGRQPGGECKVNGDKSLSNNKKDKKKKRDASNTRKMLRTKEARKLRLGPTQKNYERKMNKA